MQMSDDALIRLANLKALGHGPADLVRLVGSSYPYWRDLLAGNKSFGEKAARNIEEKLGLPRGCLDLADGCGIQNSDSTNRNVIKLDGIRNQKNKPDELVIPQYAVGGAMGNGLILEEKQPGIIKSWNVDHEWLRLNVRHHTGVSNLCIVTGFGPSMQPKYNPGDPLLLDRGVNTVETEGIFFFRVGKHGYIKQLQRIPTEDGLIVRAKSLNPTYDPFDITAKMDFEVFGKVLTVWRSEQV